LSWTVLVGPDAQGRVLVRDPRQQLLRHSAGGADQRGGEARDRPGQRLLLGTVDLVATVEGAVEQPRVVGEQVFVETSGDLPDVLPHHGQRRLDDGPGPV
jgi:hypothetical protein